MGYIDNEVVINPTRSELKHSVLNLVVTGVKKKKIGEDLYLLNCFHTIFFFV